MPIDIREDLLQLVQEILRQNIPQHKVIAFGSRVRGDAKQTSDLDLCIVGPDRLTFEALSTLRDDFSLSRIPFRVDVVEWVGLSPEFKDIVEENHVVVQAGRGAGT